MVQVLLVEILSNVHQFQKVLVYRYIRLSLMLVSNIKKKQVELFQSHLDFQKNSF